MGDEEECMCFFIAIRPTDAQEKSGGRLLGIGAPIDHFATNCGARARD